MGHFDIWRMSQTHLATAITYRWTTWAYLPSHMTLCIIYQQKLAQSQPVAKMMALPDWHRSMSWARASVSFSKIGDLCILASYTKSYELVHRTIQRPKKKEYTAIKTMQAFQSFRKQQLSMSCSHTLHSAQYPCTATWYSCQVAFNLTFHLQCVNPGHDELKTS